MSVITPSSELRLLKVPIQIDERNQLDFANETAQYNYFNGLSDTIYADDFTYIRENSIIRFPACKDDIINYNYVMYKNSAFSDKWFYAFITKMEYINNDMTAITIKEDSFQTWILDVEFKKSFIERKHTTDDTVGSNVIEEGLATGDYIIDSVENSSSSEYACVLATTISLYELLTQTTVQQSAWDYPINSIGGVPSSAHLWAFPIEKLTTGTDEVSGLNVCINALATAGKSDSIIGVFVVPITMLNLNNSYQPTSPNAWHGYLSYNYNDEKWYTTQQSLGGAWFSYEANFKITNETITINKPTTIDGYTPRNKKLLTEAYSYLLVDNNGGASGKYAYELFSTTNCIFNINGVPTPSCSIRAIPQNYNSVTSNNLEGINGCKLPVGSWENDVYTNWLTQNGVNVFGVKLNAKESGIAGGLLQTGLGVLSTALGNPFGIANVIGGIGDIFDTMKEDYQHSIIPPQAEGNTNSGDVTYTLGNAKFSFYHMSIRQQYARNIDNFFDMFGYKFNSLEVPVLKTRTYWNYIKTKGLNVVADIPQESLDTIKNIFNNGVTIWHDPTKFLDYSQTNSIITP